MPVYNSGKFIEKSIDSILKQSFADFEFIIIDDVSTDNTRLLLDEIQDSRIIRINNSKQTGNYKCRNQGLSISKGKYICVMDSDDIAHSDRLLKQYNFMESNPQFMATGSDIIFFGNNQSPNVFKRLRDEHEIKTFLLKDNVCTHPSLIFRKEVFSKYGITYNENYYYAADYNLMVDISKIGAITNIPEPLLCYRIHSGQITSNKHKEQMMFRDQIQLRQLSFLKIRPSIDEMLLHLCFMNELPLPESKLSLLKKWQNKLALKNRQTCIYKEDYLYHFLEERKNALLKKIF